MFQIPRNSCARPWPSLGIVVVFGFLLACLPGRAAQEFHLTLRNGDRLSGTILEEDFSRIIFSNAVIGRVQISVSQIERREPFVTPPATVAAPKPARAGANTNAATGLLMPRPTSDQGKRFEEVAAQFMTRQISAAEFEKRRAEILGPPRPPTPKLWSGEILAGIDLGYGSKTRQNVSGRLKLNFTDKRLRNAFDSLFTYGRTEDELVANRLDATDKLDYDLTKRTYVYALGGSGFDEIRKIDYYIQAGPGLGEHLIRRTNFVLNVEGGANYQRQNFEAGRDAYVFYYRLAQDLKWTISPKITIDEKLEYTPQWDDLAEFKIRGEANVRYWLLNNLSLNLTLIDLYDTRVATGIDENDLQIRSSIGVKF